MRVYLSSAFVLCLLRNNIHIAIQFLCLSGHQTFLVYLTIYISAAQTTILNGNCSTSHRIEHEVRKKGLRNPRFFASAGISSTLRLLADTTIMATSLSCLIVFPFSVRQWQSGGWRPFLDTKRMGLLYKSRIPERTISLRFLGVILWVFRFEVSVYNIYITNQFQPTFAQGGRGVVQ